MESVQREWGPSRILVGVFYGSILLGFVWLFYPQIAGHFALDFLKSKTSHFEAIEDIEFTTLDDREVVNDNAYFSTARHLEFTITLVDDTDKDTVIDIANFLTEWIASRPLGSRLWFGITLVFDESKVGITATKPETLERLEMIYRFIDQGWAESVWVKGSWEDYPFDTQDLVTLENQRRKVFPDVLFVPKQSLGAFEAFRSYYLNNNDPVNIASITAVNHLNFVDNRNLKDAVPPFHRIVFNPNGWSDRDQQFIKKVLCTESVVSSYFRPHFGWVQVLSADRLNIEDSLKSLSEETDLKEIIFADFIASSMLFESNTISNMVSCVR